MKSKFVRSIFLLLTSMFLLNCGGSSNTAGVALTQPSPAPSPESNAQIYDIDIRASTLSGNFQLNDFNYSSLQVISQNENSGALLNSSASFELVNQQNPMDSLLLGYLDENGYSLSLIHGSYNTRYFYQFGSELPLNYSETLLTQISLDTDTQQNINVPIISVIPEFSMNGLAFPNSPDQYGNIYLKSFQASESIFLGSTNIDNLPVKVIPGDYSVIYQHVSGDQVPVNKHAQIINNLTVDQEGRLLIDIETSNVRGHFFLNGGEFPSVIYESADMVLVGSDSDHALIGRTEVGASSSIVIKGNYNLHYRLRNGGDDVPRNVDAIVLENIEIAESSENVTTDITMIELNGRFLVNGVTAPSTPYESADLYLFDQNTGSKTLIGRTEDTEYESMMLIPSTYDLIYDMRNSSDNMVPLNLNTIFLRDQDLSNSNAYDIDIPMVSISTIFTLNGVDFPQSAYNYGQILLSHSDSTEEIEIWRTNDNEAQFGILPGEYSFIYSTRESSGSVMPINRHYSFIESRNVTENQSVEYDFITQKIKLQTTLNGDSFPTSAYENGYIYISTEAQDRIVAGLTHLESEPITVINGSYGVFYGVREPGDLTEVPQNTYALVDSIIVE